VVPKYPCTRHLLHRSILRIFTIPLFTFTMLALIRIPLPAMLPTNATSHHTACTPCPQSNMPTSLIMSLMFFAILLSLIMCLVKYSESTPLLLLKPYTNARKDHHIRNAGWQTISKTCSRLRNFQKNVIARGQELWFERWFVLCSLWVWERGLFSRARGESREDELRKRD
jgi:hypothetical protein